MSVVKCTNCNNKFKWYQIVVSIFNKSHTIKCKNCNSDFKLTHKSYIIGSLLSVVIPLTITIMYIIFNNNQPPISLFLFILLILIFSMVLPFIMKYEKLN
ncbi:CXXC-20-CXXC protein [Clostridium acetobutylicum]|nr:hypothetical protein [Clostridium acetobutylicum]NOV90900.1 CXXC-20-CXXC protein [Clostridium acetobutylicum]NOW16576.1 CXXC-20-CXXC protein [Clostridium acetobutylicum]NRY58899.1 CXXC-20-CXXC protein [Clostridium acetobutylicum]NYC96332.1 CXXC-20-CXXC protein [Clostridium acetobutylicum]